MARTIKKEDIKVGLEVYYALDTDIIYNSGEKYKIVNIIQESHPEEDIFSIQIVGEETIFIYCVSELYLIQKFIILDNEDKFLLEISKDISMVIGANLDADIVKPNKTEWDKWLQCNGITIQ